ncbi:MAG TPA: cryptochrome/photolyase family protein [Chloroflexi bacterium]|nr:cryptochrome/photolyase family protein [Chloroflexota bacterium]
MTPPRVSVWIPGDQLLLEHPALQAAAALTDRDHTRVVLVESAQRLTRLPYQRKKLVLLLSAMRHYVEELRAVGYTVEYRQAASVGAGLRAHVAAWQPQHLFTMATAEYSGRSFQQRLTHLLSTPVTVLPNTQFLTGRYDPFPQPRKKVVLENFYRAQRRRWGLLLDAQGEPLGGAWNFDQQNRKPLPRTGLAIPPPLAFAPDALTQQVMAEVAALPTGVGRVDGFDLAVTRQEAEAAFDDFLRHRLANFGPYEDAMSQRSAVLFHALLSPYMNIGLLDPLAMARRAEAAYHAGLAPLASVEGFIRQIVGWREYIYWQYWRQMPGLLTANSWRHTRPLPGFFWTGATPMHCLHRVVNRVIDLGYSHHIERLMVICNFCMLAGIDPAAVNAWFLTFYVDAYEWVVTPNVIGMGLNADGGQTATKPYIASANYIHKMSDYCADCPFNPKARTGDDACPFNVLYWNFLLEHEATLRANPRFGPAVLGLKHLTPAERTTIRRQAAAFLATLSAE